MIKTTPHDSSINIVMGYSVRSVSYIILYYYYFIIYITILL